MTLDQIGLKTGTDKSSKHHNYLSTYEKYFEPFRHKPITIIEIGVGGYHHIDRGGESLRMWRGYFSQARIIGIDIYEKSQIDGVEIYKASQDDKEFLTSILKSKPDIVIDDASHINELTIKTFEIVFPLLKSGALYVVEDCHTSYWTENYGGSVSPVANTTMNYFKRLTDSLNHETNGFGDSGAEWIHFYKQLIIIKKK